VYLNTGNSAGLTTKGDYLKNDWCELGRCRLFDGVDEADLEKLLNCLRAVRKTYRKGAYVSMAGDSLTSVGIVLSGSVHIINDDFWGNRTIIARLEPPELFGEAFAFSENVCLPGIVAAEKSDILLIRGKKIVTTCPAACIFHTTVMKNLIRIMAEKNGALMQKIEHITRRTTREKLLSYFSFQAMRMKDNTFEIPFNRQELADYLSVDRSAMSSELSRMRGEGMLDFSKNRFTLLRDGADGVR
jgi:CRP-like cAMP-binding protein